MSVKLTSRITMFAVGGILTGSAMANGCSSSSGNRNATGSTSSGTSSSASTTSTSASSSTSSSASGGSDSGSTSAPACTGFPSDCSFPTAPPDGGLLFAGGQPSPFCSATYSFDGIGGQSWFAYGDSAGAITNKAAITSGCGSEWGCAFNIAGTGFSQYAGIGLTLGGPNTNAPVNLTAFDGVYAWVMGSTTDTRAGGSGSAYNDATPDTVHIKFVTGVDGGDELDNDDFGFYCTIQPTCWTLCQAAFANLAQDKGYGIDDASAFDSTNVIKVQFEASGYTPPDGGTASMNVNFSVANVAFYSGSGGVTGGDAGSDAGAGDASADAADGSEQ